ncbi:hypothetical protein ACFORO_42705 [Amycolatopsis halotolerans]|uniref:Methyl-accepting chemotaxis protein n=1 Tax=Amycolatopsis halotolerans TaxID=330083 RepID=A0ABV7QWV4_9PSEU
MAIGNAIAKCNDFQAVMMNAANIAEEIKQMIGNALANTELHQSTIQSMEQMQASVTTTAQTGSEFSGVLQSIQERLQSI